jgi:TRAP-type C4-dicarboxylate transport system permease small subunit
MNSNQEEVTAKPGVVDESKLDRDEGDSLGVCIRWLVFGEKAMASLFLLLILTTMGAQVFARYVFGSPFQWSEEVARLALIWMTFISASFVMAEGRHIAVDMVSTRVGNRGKLLIECLGYAVVAGACLLLLIGGARFVWYVGKVGSPALGVPKSWWYGAGMVGLLLMAVHSLLSLVQVWKTGKPIPRETNLGEEGFQLEMERSE